MRPDRRRDVPVNPDKLQPRVLPRFEATAQGVSGDVAAIAYSVERVVPGPNGESQQAFIVATRDAGGSWFCVPLVRTIWSCIRFWGFPVWPPEYIATVTLERELVCITFRDEWVIYEPGGESLWSAKFSSRGLWTVRRVRLMNYDRQDSSEPVQAIQPKLPEGFRAPPAQLLERLAERLAAHTRAPISGRAAWALAIPGGVVAALTGSPWRILPAIVVYLIGLEVASILLERRRYLRTISRP
jgi:hypothetical protein